MNNTGGESHAAFLLCSAGPKAGQSPICAELQCLRRLFQLLLGNPTQRCGNIQDKDPLLLSFPGVIGKSICPDRCSVRGLRPLFRIIPKVFRKGCRLKLLLQCLETLHILQGGLSGQQVDHFDSGYRQNENF